jgi:nicotinic acid phosphoribosyltransferase
MMATKKIKQPRVPRDNEIAAMAAMVRILKRLSHEARLEVVEFATRRVQRMQAEEVAAKAQQQTIVFPIVSQQPAFAGEGDPCSEPFS